MDKKKVVVLRNLSPTARTLGPEYIIVTPIRKTMFVDELFMGLDFETIEKLVMNTFKGKLLEGHLGYLHNTPIITAPDEPVKRKHEPKGPRNRWGVLK